MAIDPKLPIPVYLQLADPRGDVLAEAGAEEAVVRAVLDLAAIDRERVREPALRLRQPELYRHGSL